MSLLKEHNVVKIGQGAKLNVAYDDNSNLQWYLPVWGKAIGWKSANSQFWLDALQARREALKPVTEMDFGQSKKAATLKEFGFSFRITFKDNFCKSTFAACVIKMCTAKRARESTLFQWCPKKEKS